MCGPAGRVVPAVRLDAVRCRNSVRGQKGLASVRAAYQDICDVSRTNAAGLTFDETVTGRGDRLLWRIHLHMLRELAQHLGHAEILREQLLASRTS